MSNHGVVLYFVFGTVLFFFWVYGIASFVVDLRRQIIPWVRARWGAGASDADPDPESDPESEPDTERLRELYGDSGGES